MSTRPDVVGENSIPFAFWERSDAFHTLLYKGE